jgi:hypothetical protein
MGTQLPTLGLLRTGLRKLYRDYRTALFNREYYGCRLEEMRTRNRTMEIAIAVGTSSAIGSWLIWTTPTGEAVWASISAVTAVLAIVKPFLDYPGRIERYSKLFAGHGDVYYDLDQIVQGVQQAGDFTPKINKAYAEVLARVKELAPDDDPKLNQKLGDWCYDEVNRKLPPDQLWMP